MSRPFQEAFKMLTAKAATGIGSAMEVAAFRHLILELHTTGNANFTMKVQGSLATVRPTFGSAASPTNPWTYLQIVDLDDQTLTNGTDGIVAIGTDINKQYEINTNGQKWVNVVITAYAAGAITVYGMPFDDNE